MEGQGVTNYSVDKPTYAFSSSTTEFDDALIRRGVVTLEQAIGGKGASESEAQRLAALARSSKENPDKSTTVNNSDVDSDDEFLDDDDFMAQYRAKRLAELKQGEQHATQSSKKSTTFGQVVPIQRPEWSRQVNDASHNAWVVVTLTSSSHSEITAPIESTIDSLATQCPSVKFVTIPSTSAIANWPDSNLPSIFIYRDGKMAQELVQMKQIWTPLKLVEELASAGGVEFPAEEIENVKEYNAKLNQDRQYTLRRQLQMEDYEEEDDDLVM
ncbi:Phosducin-like protein 3 [Seminavis robusta]|uniref:Phosducin-like protein 3 n=1 Tax=Seminavis robusta TaxID=568900 RepID=A0A9N8EUD8_9STRA|nr:Phosducin-like protein 3 [Seminavis robusta]|eukprot:Sro1650_g288650.1 Phosducin-like protein 3 (271) ;mRNA; f:212-1024